MTIIKFAGGLGNQLFQYSFGKYIEKLNNCRVKYDVQTNIDSYNFTKRDLEIEKFNVKFECASEQEVKKFLNFEKGILWRLERKYNQKVKQLNKKYLVQKNAHSLEVISDKETYYDGYWQCYQYVDEIREVLLEELGAPQSFYQKHELVLREMQDSSSVSIHVRRDDYINIKANALLFEVCEMDYYTQAILLLNRKLENPKFFIFSQDEEWVRNNFKGENFCFIKDNSAIDDLLLMSHCKHNIIANSTFSWWSAWLNRNPSKNVIAPKKWYKGKKNSDTINLIPNNWVRI